MMHPCAGADLAGKLILGCCQCSKEFHSSCAQICARWEAYDGQAIQVSASLVAASQYSGKSLTKLNASVTQDIIKVTA